MYAYRESSCPCNYVNHGKSLLINKWRLIYFVKWLYNEIVMHIGSDSSAYWSNRPLKWFWPRKTYSLECPQRLLHLIQLWVISSPPKTSASDTALGHIFSPKVFCIWYSFGSYLLPQSLLHLIQLWVISSPPKSSASDTVLGHIFSQQCKPKQLKR